jgi:hypothetical protein
VREPVYLTMLQSSCAVRMRACNTMLHAAQAHAAADLISMHNPSLARLNGHRRVKQGVLLPERFLLFRAATRCR